MLAARKRRANFLARMGAGLSRIPAGRGTPSIWVHSVSVGETLAAAPFIRALKQSTPGVGITLSTVTLTGQETARVALGDAVDTVCFFPFDLSFVCGRFLDRIRPDAVVILETEIWPNFLGECAAREIPVVILNGRLSERSFEGYRKLGWLFRRVLGNVSSIGAQTPEDARRYAELRGEGRGVASTGNMKFDMATPVPAPGLASLMSRVREAGGRWLVAGSTHEGEEAAVLDGFARARRTLPNLHLVIAPRHPERFDRVERLCAESGLAVMRRTACPDDVAPADFTVLLLDTVGELAGAYAMADVAFVGGSLVPVGGHNILEPACFGVPVVTGPHTQNFREMVSLFIRAEAVKVAESADALGTTFVGLLCDQEAAGRMGKRGRDLMLSCQGATSRNVSLVLESAGVARDGRS
jgi:3-deoxy-D-manno-octulosonic-acid transferase